jgi:hypothetical protein
MQPADPSARGVERGRRVGVAALSLAAALATLALAAPSAPAAISGAVDLADGYDARFAGANAGDGTGNVVAPAGDPSGDGIADFLIAARRADYNGRTNSGSVYLVYGKRSPGSLDLANFGAADGIRIDGAVANDELATAAVAAGDVNGDGIDDVAVAAAPADNNGRLNSGSVWVVFGGSAGNVDLANLGSRGFRIDGAARDDILFSLAGVDTAEQVAQHADLNGDGRADIIVAARGADNAGSNSGSTYVVYGKATTTTVDLLSLTAADGFRIDGAAADDESGYSVARVADCSGEGDGRGEIAIGARYADNNLRTSSGSVYLVDGTPATTPVKLGTPGNPDVLRRYDGAAANDALGSAVGQLGDLDGNGCGDLVAGAPGATTSAGKAYVLLVAPPAIVRTGTDLAGSFDGFRIDGATGGDQAGFSAKRAGDVNGDGRDDVAIGAPGADARPVNAAARTDAGAAYVVYGKTATAAVSLASLGTAGFAAFGGGAGDHVGTWLGAASAGDPTGDGYAEVLAGAMDSDVSGRVDAGAVYLLRANTAPANASPPAISGTARDGELLAVNPGAWRGIPPPEYDYRWLRCDSAGACAAIANATAATYRLTSADVGATVRVEVTARSARGVSSVTSAPTAAVAPAAPANTSPPTISGTLREAETLYADKGAWTGTTPHQYAYQWERCSATTGECHPINGATDWQYDLREAERTTPGDAGWKIRVIVTTTNAGGTQAATSAQVGPVDPAAPAALAPDTALSSGTAGTTQSTSASFSFSSTQQGVTFECRLDRAMWAACSSPKAYSGLADGPHTFEVRARDLTGNPDRSPAARTWTVDTRPPDTTITSGPSGEVSSTSSEFAFSANEPATFQCRIDGSSWASCASPKTYSSLSQGPHSFEVRAIDAAGLADATPARRDWTIDTLEPQTTIDSGPDPITTSRSAELRFSSSEPGAHFDCRLDGGSWTACTSPTTYEGLADGTHVFAVRATDRAGNTDMSPAAHPWVVDTTPPETTIDSAPASVVRSGDATFAFSSDDAASFECRLDAGPWQPCTSAKSYGGLAVGPHRFEVRAIDARGLVDQTPATKVWDRGQTCDETASRGALIFASDATAAARPCRRGQGA